MYCKSYFCKLLSAKEMQHIVHNCFVSIVVLMTSFVCSPLDLFRYVHIVLLQPHSYKIGISFITDILKLLVLQSFSIYICVYFV